MKTKYLTFAALALALAACEQDVEITPVTPQDNLKDTPITVTAGVAELTTRAGYETNKDDDTQSVLPEKFYLSITQDTEDATSKYNYTNMLMTKAEDDNTYTPSATLLWKDSNRDVAVNAYTTDAETFTVQTDQSTEDGVLASDLLGAVKKSGETSDDVTIAGDNIGISFRHLLCKLDVTFSWGTEFITGNKSIKSIVYSGFGTSATLKREDGTVTADETATDNITAYVTTTDEGVTYLSEAIFAPHVGAAPSILITAIIDDVERDFSIGVNPPAAGFASGNRYTMNVTIGGTTVEDALVTVNIAKGWEDGDTNGDEDGTTGNMATN